MSFPVQGYFDPRSVPFFVREPTSEEAAFSGNNVAPHGDTLRSTYTVPTGKLAKVSDVSAFIFRRTVDSGVGNVEVIIASSVRGNMALIKMRDNTLGANQRLSQNGDFLESGEAITINTEDDGTDGRIDYRVMVSATEFEEPPQ